MMWHANKSCTLWPNFSNIFPTWYQLSPKWLPSYPKCTLLAINWIVNIAGHWTSCLVWGEHVGNLLRLVEWAQPSQWKCQGNESWAPPWHFGWSIQWLELEQGSAYESVMKPLPYCIYGWPLIAGDSLYHPLTNAQHMANQAQLTFDNIPVAPHLLKEWEGMSPEPYKEGGEWCSVYWSQFIKGQ